MKIHSQYFLFSNTMENNTAINFLYLKLFPGEISILKIGLMFCLSSRTFDKNKLAHGEFQFVFHFEQNGSDNSTITTKDYNDGGRIWPNLSNCKQLKYCRRK